MEDRRIRRLIEGQEILACSGKTLVNDAARMMKKAGVGALLVVEDGKLTGIFTERDALFRVIADEHNVVTTRLDEVMTRNPKSIHPDRPFNEALHMMYEGKFRHVPVVEDGRPIGVVSARDALGPELEDFVYELLRLEQADDILA